MTSSARSPRGARSVMQSRLEPPDSLDYFPTPPWATRAFLAVLSDTYGRLWDFNAWEPACGEGHMGAVLREHFGGVVESDVFDYGRGAVVDFLSGPGGQTDWIITNPPFKTALDFAIKGLERSRVGVALLVRTSWLEGGARWTRLFNPHPPQLIVQYAERVPMTKGRWDPDASTATSYCWVVWHKPTAGDATQFRWIPPGQRKAMTRAQDAELFGVKTASPLFEAAA